RGFRILVYQDAKQRKSVGIAMGDFLTAAYQVLKMKGSPLTATEITSAAVESNLLDSHGLTPWQTMKSKLSTDILNRGDKSKFMRSDAGRFALREWKGTIAEHVADRYQ